MAETLTDAMGGAELAAAKSRRPNANGDSQTSAAGAPTIMLAVADMHCGGCMRKVEGALSALPDVASARANLAAKRVSVQFHHGAAHAVEPLLDALDAVGFRAAQLHSIDDEAAARSERDLLVRLAVAGFAAANVMLLSVSVWSGRASGDMGQAQMSLFHLVAAALALPTVAYSGQPFFRSAASALRSWRLNMDVPISLGVLLATGMSVFQTFWGHGHVYFDAAVMLLFFLLIGRFLDARMRRRAAGAASDLLAFQALSADVVEADGTITRLPSQDLVAGMRVRVQPGQRIPVDGTVVSGRSDVDNSIITGESASIAVGEGDQVYAGAISLNGHLIVESTAVEAGTVLSEIARLMATAEQNRSRYVRLADRAAKVYAPAVHVLGLATLVGWLVLGFHWVPALTAAIAVLIITCPCALALAVPAVQVAATSRLFDTGVLVKSPDGLERLAACDTVVFDKTGTLTRGDMRLLPPTDAAEASLAEAAGLAACSHHPYSRALVKAARQRGLDPVPCADVEERPGQGLVVRSPDGGETRLGSAEFCGVTGSHAEGRGASLWFQPSTAPHASIQATSIQAASIQSASAQSISAPMASASSAKAQAVCFMFRDDPKDDAVETVQRLRRQGVQVEILSGDQSGAVASVADALGIANWRAGVTPSEKVARLEDLKAEGRKVAMVGDGLNDAPSLAGAHASLSPAEAADISQTSADVIFQGGKLGAVADALSVARAAQAMSFQNFMIALGYNVVFVPIAVIGWVTPLIAAIAMSASSIAVTANAVRLRHRRIDF